MKWWEKWYFGKSLRQKLSEFHGAGYEHVTRAELWEYCQWLWSKKKVQKKSDQRQLLQQVTPYDFFDYQQIQIRTHQESLQEMEDFSDLF
ncbi:post-transcriptional regulator [Enterococcus asini]|uniref:Post-transcriptional regulator n=1 Tax=Enterococcus asini TaxID=57732 RepID=A0AAW8TVJ2_9ENTE|nr:post-transcriptional regulator [Enterococcus asini]MDT2810200.1 post-transcriptional regulator [Enterococcus asini]